MTESKNQFQPDYMPAPGSILDDILHEQGMQQKELAKRTGFTPKTINEIIKGKARITPDTALCFERVFGTPASFWNNAQARYDEHNARLADEKLLEKEIGWLDNFKTFLKELIKRNWIKEAPRDTLQLRELLNFFSVSHVEDFECVWKTSENVAFRMSEKHDSNPFALAAWLRQGERLAHEIQCKPFDERKLKEALTQARSLTLIKDPQEMTAKLIPLMAEAGVAVIFLKELKGAKINGAINRLLPEKAVIQLSIRHCWADIMWFTFFHEAFHLLENKGKGWKIDSFAERDDEEERLVDKKAADFLIPPSEYEKFLHSWNQSADGINRFAKKIGIHPGIVAGRLQHDGKTAESNFNKGLRFRYIWE